MDKEQLVCNCINVTLGDIENAIQGGAKSFEEVQNITKVGTGCTKCVDSVKILVSERLK